MSFRMVITRAGIMMGRRALLAGLLAVAGCNSGGSNSPILDSVTGTALGPKARDPKSFVVESRPADGDYLPVGVTPPARAIKPKTAAELAVDQAAMTGRAQSSQGLGVGLTAEGARVKASAPKVPKVE